MSRGVRIGIAVVAIVVGTAIWPSAWAPVWGTFWERTLWVGIFLAFVSSGLVAWGMRPENLTGKVLVVTGFAFALQMLAGLRDPLVWTLSVFGIAFIPLMFYALLVFPDGRLHGRAEKLLMIYMGGQWLWGTSSALLYEPADLGCPDCPPGLNLLLLRSDPVLLDRIQQINGRLVLGGLIALVVILARRWLRASVPARRVLAPMLVPASFWWISFIAYYLFQQSARHSLFEPPEITYQSLATGSLVSLLLLPLTFLLGLSRYRARRARVSGLFIELGELPPPEQLRDSLARTFGDPELEVGIWVPEAKRYLTPEGKTLQPVDTPEKTPTYLERDKEPLAVILHDSALLDDPRLVDSVAAGARLAVENDRLQAELRTQLEEVRVSRARILEAGDEERRKIERDLHDGAQARLLALSLALQVVTAKLDSGAEAEARQALVDIGDELRSALAELRELARGIHPAVLTNEGLGAALEVLADRTPMEIVLASVPDDRLPASVEAAGYFVVAEALANAARYSGASKVTIDARVVAGDLAVEVRDDGVGGASLGQGSGLRGLADRVHALDGDLEVESPPGSGTIIRAWIPCG